MMNMQGKRKHLLPPIAGIDTVPTFRIAAGSAIAPHCGD